MCDTCHIVLNFFLVFFVLLIFTLKPHIPFSAIHPTPLSYPPPPLSHFSLPSSSPPSSSPPPHPSPLFFLVFVVLFLVLPFSSFSTFSSHDSLLASSLLMKSGKVVPQSFRCHSWTGANLAVSTAQGTRLDCMGLSRDTLVRLCYRSSREAVRLRLD